MIKKMLVGLLIAFGVALVILLFALFGLGVKSITKPLSAEIDQKTFMHSQQFVDSEVRDLQTYMREYQTSDEVQKAIIRETVRHQYANFPEDKIPQYLKSFYMEMMS